MGKRLDGLVLLFAGILGAAAFWSTALAEAAGVALIAAASARAVWSLRAGEPVIAGFSSSVLAALACWGVYLAAVALSIGLARGDTHGEAGLLWHPLLFPAALLFRPDPALLRKCAKFFVLNGAAAGVTTLLLNAAQRSTGPLFTFTGLTTFADLLVLAGAIAIAFLFRLRRPGGSAWGYAVPGMIIPAVLVWSGQRAPVLAMGALGSVRAITAGPRILAAWLFFAFACVVLGPRDVVYKMDWLMEGKPVDRYVVWHEAIRQLPGTPIFGHGPGSYAEVLPGDAWGKFINRPPSSWHNDLLETWLDSGPCAAISLAGLLLAGALRGARVLMGRGRAEIGGEAGVLFLCLVLFGLVGSVVTTAVLGLAFWLLLGLTLNPAAGSPSSSLRRPAHPPLPGS